MHIVSRPIPIHSMLALTVDRLVGNGSSHHHHHHRSPARLSLSPDSSDNASDSGSVRSSSTERQTPPTVPTKSMASSPSPSHFSKITLLLSNNNNSCSTNANSIGLISCDERSRPPTPVVKEEWDGRLTTMGRAGESRGTENETRVKLEISGERDEGRSSDRDCCDKSRLAPTILTSAHGESEDDEDQFSTSSSSQRSPRLIEDHCCGRLEPESESKGRPPSRPSSATSTGSSSTTPLLLTQAQHQHNSLKFSIHDILRPDFGQRAIRKPYYHSNNFISIPQPSHKSNGTSHRVNNRSRNNSGVTEPRPARPSSVKNHSEDSNSSCTSRSTTKEEVVDESKVNPAVPKGPLLWPAWVYCTRYSDRPSSGKYTFTYLYYIHYILHITFLHYTKSQSSFGFLSVSQLLYFS